ncbi:transmembrane protein, putative (macronuclear) [Tetrahymena thermophila SB210]|uniref:Transmembrane protein, putative n=1 Tax=Tetrahymena thermophila (strain SB210) TaxID=312017 RepID=W7XI87_TETTS|nr:transmembrane protein, putative [Tetrahymena thermophila SB210]EWS74411.1 transmembrane protein, putative [Tetrahymena thermophila SB210]|eukprot:XP_012653088.1 transmembrane protein, putative [Tetrahymena thermophila SB210]
MIIIQIKGQIYQNNIKKEKRYNIKQKYLQQDSILNMNQLFMLMMMIQLRVNLLCKRKFNFLSIKIYVMRMFINAIEYALINCINMIINITYYISLQQNAYLMFVGLDSILLFKKKDSKTKKNYNHIK